MPNTAYQGIDHIVIRLSDAEPLFKLFSGPLGLPVTWPLERAPFATFGWIGVGNTNLELWAATGNSDLPNGCPFPLVHGFAFEPENLATSLAELASRGIECKTPRAYQTVNDCGVLCTNFTNSVVLDVSSDSCCVFFCEWDSNAPIVPWEKGIPKSSGRNTGLDALKASGGGPLGLRGLSEIVLTTRNPARTTDKWQRLTDSFTHPIELTADVMLHVLEGPHDVIHSLTFAVRDLAKAKDFLASRGLLEANVSEVLLSRVASGGLTIRFVEGKRPVATGRLRPKSVCSK